MLVATMSSLGVEAVVRTLACHSHSPTERHCKAALKIIGYLPVSILLDFRLNTNRDWICP